MVLVLVILFFIRLLLNVFSFLRLLNRVCWVGCDFLLEICCVSVLLLVVMVVWSLVLVWK